MSVAVSCVECSSTVLVPPSRAAKFRFCSWNCRSARPRDNRSQSRVKWACVECGSSQLKQPSESFRRFCSLACRDANTVRTGARRVERVALECRFCGRGFSKLQCQVQDGRGIYCSRKCAGLGRPLDGKPSRIASDAIAKFLSSTPVLAIPELRVGVYSIDLAIPALMVAVELDGVYWHSLPGSEKRDAAKDVALAERGWRVVRVPIAARDSSAEVAARILGALDGLIPKRRAR